MQDLTEYKKTEQYAIEEEMREMEWQEQYISKLPELVAKINYLLGIGTEESIGEIESIFFPENGSFEPYKKTDVMAQMYVVMNIYQREKEAGITEHILAKGRTIEELQEYLQEIKFMLYRLDFEVDEQTESELVEFLKENKTTTIALELILVTNTIRLMNVVLKLENVFQRNGMLKEYYFILDFIDKRWPGNWRILYSQAQFYEMLGRRKDAQVCLKKIPVEWQAVDDWEDILEIQQQFWKLNYQNAEVWGEIVRKCSELHISAEELRLFLDVEFIMGEEQYILLSEAFRSAGMLQHAMVCLNDGVIKREENEFLGCLLAELYVGESRYEEAINALEQIKNPGEMTWTFSNSLKSMRK